MSSKTRFLSLLTVTIIVTSANAQTIQLPPYVPGKQCPVAVFSGIESVSGSPAKIRKAVVTGIVPALEPVKLVSSHTTTGEGEQEKKIQQKKSIVVRATPIVEVKKQHTHKGDADEKVINVEVVVEATADGKNAQESVRTIKMRRVQAQKESAKHPATSARNAIGSKVRNAQSARDSAKPRPPQKPTPPARARNDARGGPAGRKLPERMDAPRKDAPKPRDEARGPAGDRKRPDPRPQVDRKSPAPTRTAPWQGRDDRRPEISRFRPGTTSGPQMRRPAPSNSLKELDAIMASPAGQQIFSLMKENLELKSEMKIRELEFEAKARIAELELELEKRELEIEMDEVHHRLEEMSEIEEAFAEEREHEHNEIEEMEHHIRATEERFHRTIEELEVRGRRMEEELDKTREENDQLRGVAEKLEKKLAEAMKHSEIIKRESIREMDAVKSESNRVVKELIEKLKAVDQKAKSGAVNSRNGESRLKKDLEAALKGKAELEHRARAMENKVAELEKKLATSTTRQSKKRSKKNEDK